MITLEERELERRFGDQWREYKRRVPAFLPLSRASEKKSSEGSNEV
jgi:protein-S-isoprenylcysteine O-methyltransferase Ste14